MLRARFLEDFTCLGDRCADTCCKGWGMQVDDATFAKYEAEAPELLSAVTSGEAAHVMKRDAEDYCVKFTAGWCGIQKEKGDAFLGDACHFFPRVTRALGDTITMTATLSCPETARLMLTGEDPFQSVAAEEGRLPDTLLSYLPETLSVQQALDIHQLFLASIDAAHDTETHLIRLHTIAQSLDAIEPASWPVALPFYLNHVTARLPVAEPLPQDPFYLINALIGLIGAARQAPRPRLAALLADMEQAFALRIDTLSLVTELTDSSSQRWQRIMRLWQDQQASWQPMLRRWLQAQLSIALFPFAGLGANLAERVTLIAVRFATLRLALMCRAALSGDLQQDDFLRIVQSLARFLDHLADPALSLAIYHETGWMRGARLRGLLELG